MSKRSCEVTGAAKNASERRAVAALRKAEMNRAEHAKYTIRCYTCKRTDGIYPLPFYCPSDEVAAESMRSFVKDVPALAGCDLYCIGEYNIKTGVIKPYKVHHFITY